MSIGVTLAAARRRAGLTVSELSQRTRVTESIIRGIEQDDYTVCGGDYYVRGHIRAIARAVGEDPVPLIDDFDVTWRSAKEITAAEAFQPGMPIRTRERRRMRWTAFLGVLALAVLGFASYRFVSGAFGVQRASAASPRPSPAGSHASLPSASAPAVRASTSPGVTPPASTPPPVSATPFTAQALAPASVTAFGPAGTGNGDNPQYASFAVSGNPATPWYSLWYATADFAALKTGTGLLLDMGHPVTVSSVRLSLVSGSGADIQLRAGSRPVPAWLTSVASASNAGGAVRVQLSAPVHVRYLLIWFTKLPPDAAGTYQAGVYKIGVQGQP